MNIVSQITEFLVCNLSTDETERITPPFVSNSSVWDLDPELEIHWSILHWKTQAQICFEVSAAFAECCFD